jgi:hypothetical protein
MGDEQPEAPSELEKLLAENNIKPGKVNIEGNVSCTPQRTVHCVPGTCTRTEIIVLFE